MLPYRGEYVLIDFRKMFSGVAQPISKQVLLTYNKHDFNGFCVEKPVVCDLKLKFEKGSAKLEFTVKASVLANCARCLDDVKEDFEFERIYFIKNNEWTVDDQNGNNLPFEKDGKLSIEELVFSELMLEVPQIMLCSENCAGICQVCGNRKAQGCTCTGIFEQTSEVDERLSALKQLLTD